MRFHVSSVPLAARTLIICVSFEDRQSADRFSAWKSCGEGGAATSGLMTLMKLEKASEAG